MITCAFILNILDLDEGFIYGRGFHVRKLSYYESRRLKGRDWNIHLHDMKLIALIHILKMWKHYLMGRRF